GHEVTDSLISSPAPRMLTNIERGGGTEGPPPVALRSQAVARRVCIANRLPTASTTRMAMMYADQASAVTPVKANANGLTNRITARTRGTISSPPALLIAAFSNPPSAISTPSTYAAEAATVCDVSPKTNGVTNVTTPRATTTQSCQRLHA